MNNVVALDAPGWTAAAPGYETSVVRDAAGLAALREEWTSLYEAAEIRNPFLSYEWTAGCWNHVCVGAELFLVTARDEGRLVGVAPLRLERRNGLRVLGFIGKGISPYTGFLVSPQHAGVDAAILEELGRAGGHWDLLLLSQLAAPYTRAHEAPVPACLRGQVRDLGWRGAAYTAFDGSWEELCKTGPSWLRRMQKQSRRFERDGGTVERFVGESAAEHIDAVKFIEDHSWQGAYGQPLARRRRISALLEEAFSTLGPRGEIELWLGRIQGELAAFQVNLLLPGKIWLYRGAYHEAYARLGPGGAVDFYAIRQAWADGRREYDFMSGDEPYKLERTDAVRPMKQLCLSPRTLRGRLAHGLLVDARNAVEKNRATRAALEFCTWLAKCPKALLPNSGVKRHRVH